MKILLKKAYKYSYVIVIFLFVAFITYTFIVGDKYVVDRKNNKVIVIGKTIKCEESAKSTMSRLFYTFKFQNKDYSGSQFFNKSKRGNICEDHFYFVEFDSTNPTNSLILLDSLAPKHR